MRRKQRLVALTIAVVLPASLSACGGGTKTVTATQPPTQTQTQATTTPSTAAPSGALTSDGVGPAKQGMSTAEVEKLFGPPDTAETNRGCELAGPNRPKKRALTWNLAGGRLVMTFEAAPDSLTSYVMTSPKLATKYGDRVGYTFKHVVFRWGDQLKPLTIGVAATPKAGTWMVTDGPKSKLAFQIEKSHVRSITGGDVQICE